MRHLASIQKILELTPIEGADKIVKAKVLGWDCVVLKDEFKVGDLVIFIEIDSILPNRPEFEWFNSKNKKVKTIRLKGQISQGLCLPLTYLKGLKHKDDTRKGEVEYKFIEDQDVTELMGIEKYEKPIPAYLYGKIKGSFPHFIPKTDETRVQILQYALDQYKGTQCYVTEKLDGTSLTCYLLNGEFGVCSRNLELHYTPDNAYWSMAIEKKLEEKLRAYGKNIAMQGEIFGNGIQNNPLKLNRRDLNIFNIFDLDNKRYYTFEELDVALKEMGLALVPLITTDYILESEIPKLVELANRNSCYNETCLAEGVVIRPIDNIQVKEGYNDFVTGRLSFKSINPYFLLKEK